MGGGGEGGQDLEYWWGQGAGANSHQVHDVVLTSMRRYVPTRFLINQCPVITFPTIKSDNIEIEEWN